jgi:hypothetical protein
VLKRITSIFSYLVRTRTPAHDTQHTHHRTKRPTRQLLPLKRLLTFDRCRIDTTARAFGCAPPKRPASTASGCSWWIPLVRPVGPSRLAPATARGRACLLMAMHALCVNS